jgi:hypothetical protein
MKMKTNSTITINDKTYNTNLIVKEWGNGNSYVTTAQSASILRQVLKSMKSDALRRQKITDIFEDRKLVGQKMKPEVKAQGMLDYELLKSGAIPGIGYMAEGGLANLTTTVAPQSGPNSKGLESLRKYATKTY